MKRLFKNLISMTKNYPGGRKRAVVISNGNPGWNKDIYLGPKSKYIEVQPITQITQKVDIKK
jgi:hypothetical protein